jgi:ferredoxin
MSEKTVQCIYYSASRTTQKILYKVAEGTGMKILAPIDLTDSKTRKSFNGKIDGDLTLVGTPVYEGSVPSIAIGPLSKLEGKGKWAVAVGVYGNRSPENYVSELSGLLRGRGFKIIAGASFVAEHSYTHKKVELETAFGRPDKADLDIAYGFGEKISKKMNAPVELDIESKPLKFGDVYLDKSKWPINKVKGRITVPNYDAEKCIQCNKCVNVCPVDAVDASTFTTDSDACIRCMACVKVCPSGAKTISFPPPVSQLISTWGQERKEPQLFL